MRFRFGDCVVDTERFELLRGGEAVEVQPKVLKLLIFLLEHRERAIAKDEILDAVWSDISTTEGSLTRAISFARAAVSGGKSDDQDDVIRTVRGRGYTIGVPVEVDGGPAPNEPMGGTGPRSGFLCRDKELRLARDALLHAMSGAGQVLLVVGEPGIGKTRLAEEVASIANERGALICWGRCPEEEGAPSFWPWVQILRAYVAASGADRVRSLLGARTAEVAEILPEIREQLTDLGAPDRADAGEARFRLFDSVTALLLAAAAQRPLLLVLDDLQSADPASLALLRFLAPSLRGSQMLVIATYRDVEVLPGHPLEGTLAELVRSQRPQRTVFLRGLTEACVRNFTKQFAGIEPSDELVDALFRRTEGNPLFLIELLQWLAAREGSLDERTSLDVQDARIPEGVRHVIGRRLEALSPACLEVLQRASVVGREFSLPVLAPICDLAEPAVLDHLDDAERRRIVEPVRDGSGRFWFTHGLIAETLRGQLGAAARAGLHRRTAEILEELYTLPGADGADATPNVSGPHLAELAHHFGEAAVAGSFEQGVEYAKRAADHAMSLLAFEEAARLYERALSLLGARQGAHAAGQGEILLALATAQHNSGDLASAKASLARAQATARETRDEEVGAHATRLERAFEKPS